MLIQTIDASMIRRCFLAGAKALDANKDIVNELNVFPVPDGDTGTNMTMTILSASKEVEALAEPDIQSLCKAMSSGSLRGARGNSGVILSQLLRGFTKGVQGESEINAHSLAHGFEKAVESAYKAVMKPKEGTILTVAKAMAEKAMKLSEAGASELEPFLDEILACGEETLAKTPDMLPVLKQAGVVDSGGQGLVEAIRGAILAMKGQEVHFSKTTEATVKMAPKTKSVQAQANMEIKFAYCTEYMILLKEPLNPKTEKDLKKYLGSLGDSLVFVGDDEMIKVHVHTNDPGLAIQKALSYGQLCNMKIDNMRMEHREKLFRMSNGKYVEIKGVEITGQAEKLPGEKAPEEMQSAAAFEELNQAPAPAKAEKKPVGFVSVLSGEGFATIFKDLGVDHVVEGGQTMNPSTEDILHAIEQVNADTVFVLPNNGNIILAAEQAAKLYQKGDVRVIPTKTIPQGLSAVMGYVPELGLSENEAQMKEEISRILTGEVTIAVRDTMIDDKQIHKDDYMGLGDSGILTVEKTLGNAVVSTVEKLLEKAGDEAELLSMYYGSDVEEAEAEALMDQIRKRFPKVECEVFFGGQPVYPYILSVE